MSNAIRIYVHGVKNGKRWRIRYNYPSHMKLSTCLAKSGSLTISDMGRIKGVGFEDGALTLHVGP
jgi:hypothetical protein